MFLTFLLNDFFLHLVKEASEVFFVHYACSMNIFSYKLINLKNTDFRLFTDAESVFLRDNIFEVNKNNILWEPPPLNKTETKNQKLMDNGHV